jgi:hypothetical protein
MSDFELAPIEDLAEHNPMVNRSQFDQVHDALMALRQAGFAGPSYRIESPYERGSGNQLELSTGENGEDLAPVS